ncbi:DUF4240 domain-containing protein [Streptomyces sp. NPDC006208]|uniref:DUF4240 domain-containing protein n=1 Tax=Streptomyces sp. NPDC006208 TaxID=3156734 RepID=UPI0033B25C4F
MHIDQFWNVIESARTAAAGAGQPFDGALVDRLATCPKQDILEYQEHFDDVHHAVYRWDVWAAAYLIGGGCSDDSFMDFRAGLISLGRDWYERAAACPDRLADHPAVVEAASSHRDEALFYEEVNYAASEAFERITADGEDFYEAWAGYRATKVENKERDHDMGEDFDFDDAEEMYARLPRLAALYLGGRAA